MRIVFMGTPDFAVGTLKSLIDSRHEVAAVVTQPDRPKGRSGSLIASPVKETAISAGIDVYQPQKVREKEFMDKLKEIAPDVIVVAAFGQILPEEVLKLPKYGCMNVHASLLPKLRGAAPIQWSVINGDKESGVTIMQMDTGIDTGDILLVEKYTLDEKETGGSLFEKLSQIGGPLMLKALDMAESNSLNPIKQDEEQHTYAKMLNKSMGEIDFNKSADEIERLIRGLNPWPSAYTYYGGKMLKIWEADYCNDNLAKEYKIYNESAKAGEITAVGKKDFAVKTGSGYLIIKSLQLEGKKRMDADAFMRGCSIKTGECLGYGGK